MSVMAFDSLRYARRLRNAAGPAFRVPEPQADVQAELMAEAFAVFAENILTKDHFEAVLDARLDARFAEQDAKFDKRFAEQDARFERRFSRQDRTLVLHTWMLGILVLVMAVPQLQAWLA